MKSIERPSRSGRHRKAFTLIELLVVISIILILLGLSLKVMSIVNRRGSTARTTWILEQVKNALGAYYSLYGTYPPVNTVSYQYGLTSMSSLPDIPTNMYYSTGLVYYIYSGPDHNPDAATWSHFLQGVGGSVVLPYSNWVNRANWVYWTNNCHTIPDAWMREVRYECPGPDYQRFKLWSVGPNGIDEGGGGDDIGVGWTD